MEATSRPPNDWMSFLRIDENKTELFRFLSESLIHSVPYEIKLLCAFDDKVVSNKDCDLTTLAPCNQEEGDTRVFLHVLDMATKGIKSAKVRSVDTDVVVIGTSLFDKFGDLEELWVEFGVGKNKKWYPIHLVYKELGPDVALALLFFHAFTGCDQVSFFGYCGKLKAWKTWKMFPEVTRTFKMLSNFPTLNQVKDAMPIIEQFVALMYKSTTMSKTVNEARRELFIKDSRNLENIPPTAASLYQHTLRAAYVAGYVWRQALVAMPTLPNVENWGWKYDGEIPKPYWTELPEATTVVRELIKCNCNPDKGCSGRCKCVKGALKCTELCKCNGDCETNS